jgi:hypothetical protein
VVPEHGRPESLTQLQETLVLIQAVEEARLQLGPRVEFQVAEGVPLSILKERLAVI